MAKRPGRRRRGKKDVVLDFSKVKGKISKDGVAPVLVKVEQAKGENAKGKLCLKTNSEDYDGNLSLPDKVVQREYETVYQYCKRLDRMAKVAMVEASMESRFDMTLGKNSKRDTKGKKEVSLTDDKILETKVRRQRNFRKRKKSKPSGALG